MKFIYYSLYCFYTKIPIIGNNINIYVTGAMSLLILSPFFAIYNIYNYERYGRLQYDLFTLLIPYCIIYKLLYNYYEQRGDKIVVRIDKQYNRKKNIIITLSRVECITLKQQVYGKPYIDCLNLPIQRYAPAPIQG